jgi:thioredoxin-related protein
MATLVIVILVVVVASAAAVLVQRRQPDVPSAPQFVVPQQLDRSDFEAPNKPWLLLLFSSETCLSCHDARNTLDLVEVDSIHVQDAPVETTKALHDRYAINAGPTVILADAEGVVTWSYLGAPPRDAIAALLQDLGAVPPESGTAVEL